MRVSKVLLLDCRYTYTLNNWVCSLYVPFLCLFNLPPSWASISFFIFSVLMMTNPSLVACMESIIGSFTRIVVNVRKKPISTIALQILGDTDLQNSYIWELDLMDETDCSAFIVQFQSDDWVLAGNIHSGSIVYFREIRYIQCQLKQQPVQIRVIPNIVVIDESSNLLTKRTLLNSVASSQNKPS